MKYKFIRILCFTLLAAGIAACTPGMKSTTEKRYAFADILDISYTPPPHTRSMFILASFTSLNNR